MIEQGKRAIACEKWRWMPGMLSTIHGRIVDKGDLDNVHSTMRPSSYDVGVGLPDLTDPATLGCLLALVQEAWGCHVQVTHHPIWAHDRDDNGTWMCGVRGISTTPNLRWDWYHFSAPTKAEALVSALAGCQAEGRR